MLWSGMADRVYTSSTYDLPFSWVFRENATALRHGRGTRPEQFKLCLFLGIVHVRISRSLPGLVEERPEVGIMGPSFVNAFDVL